MGFYDRHVLPHVINCACGTKPIERQRAKVAHKARGVVLELGFGSGRNLPYIEAGQIERYFALEPDEAMRKLAGPAIAQAPFAVEMLPQTAETLSLPESSVDTVFFTYTLCTIPDPTAALTAARRVLKPEGRLVFCEHGAAPDANVARTQRFIEPVWKAIAGGCHLTRDPTALLKAAGFSVAEVEQMYLPKTPRFAGYNYWGEAARA